MIDPVDKRFFDALDNVCAEMETVDQKCRDAIARARETGNPLDMRNARATVDDLDPAIRDRILAQVHRRMATDLSAIWDALPTAPKNDWPN